MVSMSLNDPWYQHVRDGLKIYEGRLWTSKTSSLKPGDELFFKHVSQPTLKVKVVEIVRYKTFEEALSCLKLSEVLPGLLTLEEGIEVYAKFFPLSAQQENGVCMIKIEVV